MCWYCFATTVHTMCNLVIHKINSYFNRCTILPQVRMMAVSDVTTLTNQKANLVRFEQIANLIEQNGEDSWSSADYAFIKLIVCRI